MSRRSLAIATIPAAMFVALSIWLVFGNAAQAAPPKTSEIASTTTTTSATLTPIFDPTTGILVGFDAGQRAALEANADVNGDGINDVILVVVDSPSPPPGAEPAKYRVFVTNGATGLTILNISISSPTWY